MLLAGLLAAATASVPMDAAAAGAAVRVAQSKRLVLTPSQMLKLAEGSANRAEPRRSHQAFMRRSRAIPIPTSVRRRGSGMPSSC